MKNQKMWKCLVIGLCMSVLTGCGSGADETAKEEDLYAAEQFQSDIPDTEELPAKEEETGGADASAENQDNTDENNAGGKVNADDLYTSATITGDVVDFSDGGCTITPTITEDDGDGKTAVGAAPGYESEDTNVTVTYREDCVFQAAAIDTQAATAELTQASAADIKEQASVIIYGSFEDTQHVSADKIIICHRTGN